MIRIDVLTTTRAEYGLMRPLLKRFQEDVEYEMHLLVTGTHLDKRYGYTVQEIIHDRFPIYFQQEILSKSNKRNSVSETMANALVSFSGYFAKEKPDFLLVDGDRYETMAICIAAVNANIPIIHLCGGATTEGASDEVFRHSITKMSYLHFPTTELYRKRIIQLGESPERVFTVGSLGIENIMTTECFTKEELAMILKFDLSNPYALITFHPVTLENDSYMRQLEELLDACIENDGMNYIITMANADTGGAEINNRLKAFANKYNNRVLCVDSLGSKKYLSAMRYCEYVMGNSSSGLVEAPSFHIPTINIGDRQKGRIKAESIIDCNPQKEQILAAMKQAISPAFREHCKSVCNPNGDGRTSERIVRIIKEYTNNNRVNLKKHFYDLDFEV